MHLLSCASHAPLPRALLPPSQEFDADDDTWESSNLEAAIVEEFEEQELLAAMRAAKPRKPPREPFTRAIADAESAPIRELRLADAEVTLDFLGTEENPKFMCTEEKPCAFGGPGHHAKVRGNTKAKTPYPEDLCRAIATVLSSAKSSMRKKRRVE